MNADTSIKSPSTAAANPAEAIGEGTSRDASASREPPATGQAAFALPEPLQGTYGQIFDRLAEYLVKQHGIPLNLIQILFDDGLLYLERERNGLVFVDPANSFAELYGTVGSAPLHQILSSGPATFWWYKPRDLEMEPAIAYVCESAIDAISLYLLLSTNNTNKAWQALYCSVGCMTRQQAIDAVKSGMSAAGCQTVLAINCNEAEDQCRQRNPDCEILTPAPLRSWNEKLLDYNRKYNALGHLERSVRLHRYG